MMVKNPQNRGFTMIELMVAMMVAGIVLTGVFSFAAIQRGMASEHGRQIRADQGLDGAMWAMGKDIEQAGLGFARTCTELRVWDHKRGRLLNPGAVQTPVTLMSLVAVDAHTEEPYWVLRDGLQAHWHSDGRTSLTGTKKRSSSIDSAADSFDVIRGDGNFVASTGLFFVDTTDWKNGSLSSGSDAALTLKSVGSSSGSTALGQLDSTKAKDLAAAQQIFVPGTFVLVMAKGNHDSAFRAAQQSQCILLQVTGNLGSGGDPDSWSLPIADTSSFNGNLTQLLGLSGAEQYYKLTAKKGKGGTGDWEPGSFDSALIVPLGHLRWSRYEIDYSEAKNPYLVRTDIIGVRRGDGHFSSGSVTYPSCPDNKCPQPKLRLPGLDSKIPRYAIAPMIEDMQVSTGCDGYSKDSVDAHNRRLNDPHSTMTIPPPDVGFDETEKGRKANLSVDESSKFDGRSVDEWVGNAGQETWAPDCVFYGTGETYASYWAGLASGSGGSPSAGGVAFRHSPQTIRVSLIARQSGKGIADPGGATANASLPALEDRSKLKAFAPGYMTQTRTERFAPPNLRWRDPAMP